MRVIYDLGKGKSNLKKSVLAIGVFDGIHRGHKELIRAAVAKAKSIRGESVVMTFHPHPVTVLHPQVHIPLIVSLDYRLKLIEQLGVHVCVVVRFTKRFSRLSPEQFIRTYLVNGIRPKEIFVGDDFKFGKDRSGTLELFQQLGQRFGFHVDVVRSLKQEKGKIGSSVIRQFISEGNLNKAKQLLGRRVSIMGKVARGDARGQRLGFPTANIIPHNEAIPPVGVYAVNAIYKGKPYRGMANVGRRPSFPVRNSNVRIEVHLFGFHKNIYGNDIIIEFIKKIRDEKYFPSQDALIAQLQKDRISANRILSSI